MQPPIDLRSDTVTHPTERMRDAIRRAEVGDDVYGEDPTVNRLQELAAGLLGKEVGLFMPTGTMSNLVALLTHCQRGDEVILGDEAHILHSEVSGYTLGGLSARPVPNGRGFPDLQAVEAAIRPPSLYGPRTGLLCLENTHNRCGGTVVSPQQMAAAGALARRSNLPLHVDGARIFNAALAQGVPAADLARDATSISFCFSKGLSAPAGSILLGDRAFIERARRTRRMVGGGMRQVGVLAAAALVALAEMVDRLAEDHAHARLLAERLAPLPGLELDLDTVQTNIVAFRFTVANLSPEAFMARLRERGVLISAHAGRRLRAVTHHGIERAHVLRAAEVFEAVLGELALPSAAAPLR
ncbi:MAG: aminotransferase class I/II-fold pyridoxal phosphate-dependent enzyme [Chloroflexi bacterium]|nr:aminotransferase class I/II-fold pyridoxal phosphate-dependent enzyme [Chloroflexota bacterium]